MTDKVEIVIRGKSYFVCPGMTMMFHEAMEAGHKKDRKCWNSYWKGLLEYKRLIEKGQFNDE